MACERKRNAVSVGTEPDASDFCPGHSPVSERLLAAELTAEKNAALDEAVLQARNVAEQLKYSCGEWEGEHSSADHIVTVRYVDSEVSGLGKAEVIVTDHEGTVLFSIPVAWQEVDGCEE